MIKRIAYVAQPIEANVLAQLLGGLNSSFQIMVEDDTIVIFREEF